MVATLKTEIELKSPADKLWKVIAESTELFPKIFPEQYKSITIVEGDGKSVGTIREIKYGEGEVGFALRLHAHRLTGDGGIRGSPVKLLGDEELLPDHGAILVVDDLVVPLQHVHDRLCLYDQVDMSLKIMVPYIRFISAIMPIVTFAKEKVLVADEENKTVSYTVIDGEILNFFKVFTPTVKVLPSEDGKACKVVWDVEYEKANDEVGEPTMIQEFALNTLKALDEHVLNAAA